MSFELLSLELLAHIVSFVVVAETPPRYGYSPFRKPSLRNYACISRHWQAVIEPHTFSNIRVESIEIDRFRRIFASKRRQWILRHLDYSVILPSYSQNRCDKFETKRERTANNFAFHQGIRDLFELLNTWDKGGTSNEKPSVTLNGKRRFSLHLNTYSLTDPGQRDRNVGYGMGDLRMADSVIEFPQEIEKVLPAISDIDEFSFDSMRQVHLLTLSQIMKAMPSMSDLNLRFIQPQMKCEVARREQWYALGQMANTLAQSPSLKSIDLYSEFNEPFNHSFTPGDMRQPDTRVDQTSLALHNLAMLPSSTLQTLTLQGWFLTSPQLFWPHDSDITNDLKLNRPLLSSHLEYIHLEANIRSPEGTWYYTGDPSSIEIDPDELFTGSDDDDDDGDSSTTDSDESTNSAMADWVNERRENILNGAAPCHGYRIEPDPKTFDPLLNTMIRTVTHLPRLKMFSFTIGMDLADLRRVVIKCADTNHKITDEFPYDTDGDTGVRRFKVWIGMDLTWEVPEQVEEMMKDWVGPQGVVQKYHWPANMSLDANRG